MDFCGSRRDGQDGVGVSAQQHKAGLTQAEQAGEAVQQVHGDRHQCVDGTLAQDGQQHGRHEAQVIQRQQDGQQGDERQRRPEVDAFFLLFHGHHTFSVRFSLNRPVGLTASTTMSSANVKASLKVVAPAPLIRLSQMPMMKAADHSTRDGADAAEHRRHEGLQAGHSAHGGGDGRVVGEVHHGADGGKEAAHGKGEADDIVDLDAHELCRLKIAGSGAHGHADPGLLDQGDSAGDQDHNKERVVTTVTRLVWQPSTVTVSLIQGRAGYCLARPPVAYDIMYLQQVRHPDGRS